MPPSPDAALRVEVMASMLALAGAWFALTALATSSAVVVRASDRARTGIDRVLGAVFVGLGATLLGHS
ncbi:Putative threonine efflux protein (fragment) [Nostocoides jenkinsii Ben 74]|uniref:Putative threonine efflux protein n=1 Tax=Nostocoides jenkinsii Ben 74 TaxID=1193518 RepID=A0A077M329_9MICO